MNSIVLRKFSNYIYYPDLSNKFIISSLTDIISSRNFDVYLKYIFSQRHNYGYIALKALMMLTSVFPKRCLMSSKLIILKYTKTRCHSVVYLKLSLDEYIPTLNYFIKNPTELTNAFHGHINESKHFIFPGFIKHLRLPRWERFVNISYNQTKSTYLYPLFFHKTAYLD